MKIYAKTTIDTLLSAYPYLADELISISPHFEKLKNPFMRKTFGKVATVATAAGVAGMGVDELIQKLQSLISSHAIDTPEMRKERLKGLILELHEGKTVDEVKVKFQEMFQGVSAAEIAAMEQALLDEGMDAEEITRLCDVHVSLFKEALEVHDAPEVAPGHPVHTYMMENRATGTLLSALNTYLGRVGRPPSMEAFGQLRGDLLASIEELSKIRLHFERKENQLFPALEAHHFTGPSQVMWSMHDQIRANLKKARETLEANDPSAMVENLRLASQAIRDMIYKEEHILFPAAIDMLSDEEWAAMKRGESAIGYAFVTPGADYLPPAQEKAVPQEADPSMGVKLDTGALTVEQVNLMLKHLPVDITFVDENDKVAYFSDTPERLFPRSPGIIGREVRNCHPPKSVHIVNMILDAFKSGEKDKAEFWLTMGEKMIYIRYFAVRGPDLGYRGCLEVSQEVGGIRLLSGERRLLEWN